MTIRAHVDAVKGLLTAALAATTPTPAVYVSRADTTAATPYVVLHPDQGSATSSTFTQVSDLRLYRFTTTCVGVTAEQVQWLAQRVEQALLDVRPAVAGRSTGPLYKDIALTVDRDEDLASPLFMARDVWVLLSVPA